MQLRGVVADQNGGDSLTAAGTGSGKTLPMALNIHFDDPQAHPITITISPLKRLQTTQANDFNNKYHIPTVTINEDTPRDEVWWNENIFNPKTRTMGTARHLIVTVEQLFKSPEGHLSRLAMLFRNKTFQKHLVRVNVDETHHIHTAGQALYGLKAFRPAWGQLDELKILLPRKVRFHAFSATLPEHILLLVQQKIMKPNHTLIRVTSNRPNTTYATHQVVNNLEDLRNYECFLATPFSLASQPHVIIFVDDKDSTYKIA